MTAVIKVMGTAFDLFDQPVYLAGYDPNGNDGAGWFEFSGVRSDALQFDTAAAALECWRQQSTVLPLRPDGKPNRPLTAYTIMVERNGEKND